ncbi:hypothetical protein T11_7356 [Trichinella zimbabwensis]|uniref:Uncharacterized protein n=1 Tax=Trichinella zimbabwensis TaxID=268475 RepID=A0A0V1GZ51_9BILA|nr:hypothetical protein T11_7356 [Trichinella zimbabwensis]
MVIERSNGFTFTNRFELYFVVPELLADLQLGLGLFDLCYFRENMTELSPDLRQLPCEQLLGKATAYPLPGIGSFPGNLGLGKPPGKLGLADGVFPGVAGAAGAVGCGAAGGGAAGGAAGADAGGAAGGAAGVCG